jgi:hypothetical protein
MNVRNSYLIVFLYFVLSSCGNRVEKIKDDNFTAPLQEKLSSKEIVFLGEMHNFGTLKAGEIVSYSFVFTNNSKIPVTIKKVDVTCGCIKVKFDDKMISPGEKSAIEVIFNTSGEWGNQLKIIRVEISSGETKELRVGAYVENEKFNNLLNAKK